MSRDSHKTLPASIADILTDNGQRLVDSGYEPIPVSGKKPLFADWQRGEITAARFAAIRAEHPDSTNIGLRTGRLVGVDIDIVDAAIAARVRQVIEAVLGSSPAVRWGAKGCMLCFRTDAPMRKQKITGVAGAVEFLGSGQQLVAWGIHPDTGAEYMWGPEGWEGGPDPLSLPLSDLPLVTPAAAQAALQAAAAVLGATYTPRTVDGSQAAAPGLVQDAAADVGRAVAYLQRLVAAGDVAIQGRGGDDSTFRAAAALRDLGISEGKALEIMLGHWNDHCRPPWPCDELAVKIASAYKYSENAPGVHSVGDIPEEWAKLATEKLEPAEKKPFLLSVADVMRWPDPAELVAGFIIEGENTCIYGQPKVGKTFIALDVALSIASGLPVFGQLEVKRVGAVVYLSGEGHAGMKRRLRAWGQMHGLSAAQMEAMPFFYKAGVPCTANGAEECQAYVEGIRAHLAGGPVLVVVDTMARSLVGLDENGAGDMGRYLEMTEGIRSQLDCTILTLAHSGKDQSRGIRGSNASAAGFDSTFEASMDDTTRIVTLESDMLKDAELIGPFHFRLKQVEVAGMTLGKGAALEPVAKSELEKHEQSERKKKQLALGAHLQRLGIYGVAKGLETRQLAERIYGQCPPESDAEAHQAWHTAVNKEAVRLKNGTRPGKGTPPLYEGYFDEVARPGSTENTRIWCLPAQTVEKQR